MRAAKAFVSEFTALGFDCHLDKPDTNPKSGRRVQVLVLARPIGPQGEAKLRAEAKKRQHTSSQATKP